MKKLIYCSALLGIGVFSSCSNPDYYNTEDGEEYRKYYVQKLKDDYEASFIKAFGEIPADLSWDLSKYAKETRANELSSDEVGGVTIDVVIGDKSNIHPYMEGGYVAGGTPSELPASPLVNSNGSSVELFSGKKVETDDTDGQNHASYGTDEYTIVSKGEIILSPLWHGNCMKDYYFVVDGFNPKTLTITRYIFSQEDIAALENYSNWNTKKPTSYTEVNTKFSGDKPKGWVFPFAEGTYVDFYLATVDDKNNLVEVGSTIKAYADASKTKNYELYGSATLHQSQNPGYSAVFFLDDTCHRSGKTNNIPGADYDYNDLVVYVAHSQQQYIPDIDEDQEIVTVPGAQKRYMVEDLGASQASDIDFNDIVIDFSESKTHIIKNTYVIENEVKVLVKTDTINTIYGQQAHVHALGGTKELCVYTTGAGGDKLVFRKST